jgi:hypothetical protein
MRLATLHHTKMVRELTAFRAAVSSTTESVLGCSPSDTSCTKEVGELAAEFQKVEDRCSRLERPAARICNLLLGPLPVQAQLANHLGEDVGHLRVEQAARRGADAEMEALQTSAVHFQDLVLGGADRPSSLAMSMPAAMELLEGWIDTVAANRVY